MNVLESNTIEHTVFNNLLKKKVNSYCLLKNKYNLANNTDYKPEDNNTKINSDYVLYLYKKNKNIVYFTRLILRFSLTMFHTFLTL